MINLEIKLEYYVGMLNAKVTYLKRIIEDTLIRLEDNPELDHSVILEGAWGKYNNKYAYFDPETERVLLSSIDDDRISELNEMINSLESLILDGTNQTVMDFELSYIHFCKTFNC